MAVGNCAAAIFIAIRKASWAGGYCVTPRGERQ